MHNSSVFGTAPNVKCFVMTALNAVSGRNVTVSGGQTQPLIDTADNIVMLSCQVQYSHANYTLDDAMVLELSRSSFPSDIWSGFVTSTTNQ